MQPADRALARLSARFWRGAAIAALAAALAFGAGRTPWLRAIENLYYDAWHAMSGERHAPRHTAFVAVDDATLLAFKEDPLAFWAPHFGRAIGVLGEAGAVAVGLDFLYQVSAEAWLRKLSIPDSAASRNYDAPLRAALAGGRAVLITQVVQLDSGRAELLLPPRDQLLLLPNGIHDLGIANLHPDEDERVRGYYAVLDPDPAAPGIALGLQLALRAAGGDPAAQEWELGGRRIGRQPEKRPIGFAGPPGTIPTLSMSALLAPGALSDPRVRAVKGRIAIIGAANAGTPDRHFTPYAEQMAGGEIHANIVETILSGRHPRALPWWAECAYLALLLAIAGWAFLRLPVPRAAAAGAVLLALAPLPAYAAFRFDWVLPAAGPQLGIAASLLATLGLRLTGEERERARIREMFGRYVSDEVAEKLLAEGRGPDLGGEALAVTILFSDIRNFTTLSETLSAHETVEMLNAYFTRVCEPILEQGGTVDKYIGDAVMAVFGSPVRHPDHARRALAAALGMARAAAEFRGWMQERYGGRGLPEFGIGVGLYTGEAVIGNIGTPRRKDFTAIGDTVNAASRLEGATKELGCVIAAAESTVAAAGPGVATGKCEQIRVKGRAQPIRVYEIVGMEGR